MTEHVNQHCALCGGPLLVRWNPSTPLLCQACGAGNRLLHALEDRAEDARYDLFIEERIAQNEQTLQMLRLPTRTSHGGDDA